MALRKVGRDSVHTVRFRVPTVAALLATAAVVSLACPAYAEVEEVIVTAQKRSENANRVGMSINALSGDDLAKMGISNPADLVKAVPGFNYTPSAYGNPVYTLRGIGFYDVGVGAAPTVAVYTDEVPLPYSGVTAGAGLDVERVEVLKGPQGTLFGANTTGGAINFIANKPTDSFAAGAEATIGSYGETDLSAYVSGPVFDKLRVRLSAKTEQRGDWQKSYTRDDSHGSRDFSAGRILADWKPTDRLSAVFSLDGWRDRSDTQAAQLIARFNTNGASKPQVLSYPFAPHTAEAADWDPVDKFKQDTEYYRAWARFNYELSPAATLTSITSYQQLRRRSVTDTDGMNIPAFEQSTPGTLKSLFQELRLSGTLTPSLKYIVGGNYEQDKIDDSLASDLTYSYFAFKSTLPIAKHRVQSAAGFVNLDWSVTEKLTLQGGARFTTERRSFEGCLYDSGDGSYASYIQGVILTKTGLVVPMAPGSCGTLNAQFLPGVVHGQLNQSNTSWRGGINYQVTPSALLYVNVSRGYKSGAFPTNGATYATQLAPAVQESVIAYEAGFKLGLFDRTVQLNGAGFYYGYTDKQLRGRKVDPIIGPVQGLINVPKSDVVGGELQLVWSPVQDLTFTASGTYIHSEIRNKFFSSDFRGKLTNFQGYPFPLAPEWQVSASGDYEPPISANANAILGYNLTYQSSTVATLGDDPLIRIDPYVLMDLRAGVTWGDQRQWRATAFVRNVTDQYYWTLVNPAVETVARITGMPRTFGVTLGLRFGG